MQPHTTSSHISQVYLFSHINYVGAQARNTLRPSWRRMREHHPENAYCVSSSSTTAFTIKVTNLMNIHKCMNWQYFWGVQSAPIVQSYSRNRIITAWNLLRSIDLSSDPINTIRCAVYGVCVCTHIWEFMPTEWVTQTHWAVISMQVVYYALCEWFPRIA